jgi:NADH dehydrogenase FAD-containing subunit
MKIGIIGWGSLIWDQRELKTKGDWLKNGPVIPIEFCRLSTDGRITLVINQDFKLVPTLIIESFYETLEEAIYDLALREQTNDENNIGHYNYSTESFHSRDRNVFVKEILQQYKTDFDALIWSDFGVRFKDKGLGALSVKNIIKHIESLDQNMKEKAIEYIIKTPIQVQTTFRPFLEAHFKK